MPATVVGRIAQVLMLSLSTGTAFTSAAPARPTVLVHVRDYNHTRPQALSAIEESAQRIFERSGIDLVWRHEWTPLDTPVPWPDVEVSILSNAMTKQKGQSEGVSELALGSGSRGSGRAYIFYDRILTHADRFGLERLDLVGRVLAHELGHLIAHLPHDDVGVMQDHLLLENAGFHQFTPEQQTMLRDTVRRAMAADAPRFALRTLR